MVVTGSARVSAGSVSVVGGVDVNGSHAAIDPDPVTHAPAMPDPFATLPAPTVGPCDQTGWSISGDATAVLEPGVYCGGLDISGPASVTLRPGVYILNGGGLSMAGGATLSGARVTIFNTGQGYSPGPVAVAGGAAVIFRPRTPARTAASCSTRTATSSPRLKAGSPVAAACT
jgi:hypothetical protein